MNKRTLVAVAALALAGSFAGTASASGGPSIPLLDEIKNSTHTCGGAIDFACKDSSGAFCTVYLNRCSIGL